MEGRRSRARVPCRDVVLYYVHLTACVRSIRVVGNVDLYVL
jgi:hypothetical protein